MTKFQFTVLVFLEIIKSTVAGGSFATNVNFYYVSMKIKVFSTIIYQVLNIVKKCLFKDPNVSKIIIFIYYCEFSSVL